MRSMVLIAMAALAVACAPKTTEGGPPPGFREGALPAPTPAGVSVRITAADAGKTITVPVGASFAVQLVGVPTAGYVWAVAQKPAFLSDAKEYGGNTTTAQSRPGFVGGNHWEVFAFEAQGAGQGVLKLEQRRPWESASDPAADTFSVTIKAQ
ncbi:MAG: protease inhibitor I42 family protein [Hyphomonadaceae bacterium]|nr:protease inhibitor I42 family protein [Hyphomonadaceae bacterium]